MANWSSGLDARYRVYFEAIYAVAAWADPGARITSAKRSTAEQARLYRRYLAGQSQFPAAPPGKSLHEKGLAIDMVARPEVLRWVGAVWTSWGGRWGGDRDPIHFEVPVAG